MLRLGDHLAAFREPPELAILDLRQIASASRLASKPVATDGLRHRVNPLSIRAREVAQAILIRHDGLRARIDPASRVAISAFTADRRSSHAQSLLLSIDVSPIDFPSRATIFE